MLLTVFAHASDSSATICEQIGLMRGPPACGKTALTLQLAESYQRDGYSVYYVPFDGLRGWEEAGDFVLKELRRHRRLRGLQSLQYLYKTAPDGKVALLLDDVQRAIPPSHPPPHESPLFAWMRGIPTSPEQTGLRVLCSGVYGAPGGSSAAFHPSGTHPGRFLPLSDVRMGEQEFTAFVEFIVGTTGRSSVLVACCVRLALCSHRLASMLCCCVACR